MVPALKEWKCLTLLPLTMIKRCPQVGPRSCHQFLLPSVYLTHWGWSHLLQNKCYSLSWISSTAWVGPKHTLTYIKHISTFLPLTQIPFPDQPLIIQHSTKMLSPLQSTLQFLHKKFPPLCSCNIVLLS
jgi:hypothetical protein